MNEKVLLYNDGHTESSYEFMGEDIVYIEQGDVGEEKDFVVFDIEYLRQILADYNGRMNG